MTTKTVRGVRIAAAGLAAAMSVPQVSRAVWIAQASRIRQVASVPASCLSEHRGEL
jgi:hypothetical protein